MLNLSDKTNIHAIVREKIELQLMQLREMLQDAFDAVADDSKSTAGDKHETSRAMAQLEQEKIGAQINEMGKHKEVLFRIDPTELKEIIGLGSLIETTIGTFYFSVGIGAIEYNSIRVFCMTPAAPLGKILLNKRKDDEISWQNQVLKILSVH